MTEQYRIARLPSPERETSCINGCAGTQRLVRVEEYKGIQCIFYKCDSYFCEGARTGLFKYERYFDCARCGVPRTEHLLFTSPEHGEVLLCRERVADASFVAGNVVQEG